MAVLRTSVVETTLTAIHGKFIEITLWNRILDENEGRTDSQILSLLWNPKIHERILQNPELLPVQGRHI
jgi:hypothetical protein